VLSDEVLSFLRRFIKSVWALELLLLMRRQAPRAWSVEGLTAELRGSTLLVSDILAGFVAAGLVKEAAGLYAYQPGRDLDRLVERLAAAAAAHPGAVATAIRSAPSDKIQTFADAFKLWKD
jgi:hypothetical protein